MRIFYDQSHSDLLTNQFIHCIHFVTGRMFDHQVLDMFELGADNYESLSSFKNSKTTMGSKPCLVFNGTDWDSTPEYQRLKNLFIGEFFCSTFQQERQPPST